jgi:hypothetical protein
MEKWGVMRISAFRWMTVMAVAFVLGMGMGLLPHGVVPAHAYQLPDTGQTKCYDNTQEIPCPQPGELSYGQDGNYQGPQPAYRDNGDGTVTDLNTGLMWEQGDSRNQGGGQQWTTANAYCTDLVLGGYSDWRLPTVSELKSLINLAHYNPVIDTAYFPGCHSFYYWSADEYIYCNVMCYWFVDFGGGGTYYTVFDPGGGPDLWPRVRCVRGGS